MVLTLRVSYEREAIRMKLYDVKLLTVICEILAQKKIIEVLDGHNILGYTISEVGGRGDTGIRGVGIPEEKNVKIEVILKSDTAEKIIEEIMALFADYSVLIHLSDTRVVRTEKFV